jgi:hypothetical protein
VCHLSDVENEPGPVEVLRNVVGGFAEVWAFLVTVAISVALVVMGNTLAQLVGAGMFVLLAIWAIRVVRRWRAAAEPGNS